jgi:hypothetical protein
MQGRHELKHSLNYSDYILLRNRLKSLMQRDAYADQNGIYRVRSLYFDTPQDKALREKQDGLDNREKFRIRRYLNGSDDIKLEKKSKKNGLSYKISTNLSPQEVLAIQANDLNFMLSDPRPLLNELYTKMKNQSLAPKTIVDYIREPFTYPAGNVRVTFDRDIRTGLYSQDFFNDNLPTLKVGDEIVVLEVKFDQFLPSHLQAALQLGNRRASACSKYALARIYG